ncbi:MAG: 4-hydroxybenzoate octaprenyltransferase [Elusimicrobiota bacterium]|nr:4-hydroxybenzoate octaprenyltransferase [Elusimicrobiota bacterium]
MDFRKLPGLLMPEQTLFALPFAWLGVLFARGHGFRTWLLVTLALAAARTAGMAFNRAIDARIDAANPRTKDRAIPRGEVTRLEAFGLAVISCLALIAASFFLNPLCFRLSFVAVALLAGYSYFKRFSASSHFCLGFTEAAAPIGGYLAVTGRVDLLSLVLGAAIMLWIAGLDIVYALQDKDFDRQAGLHSIPATYGEKLALTTSALCYGASFSALLSAGLMTGMAFPYWAALVCVAGLFIYQQKAARAADILAAMPKIFRVNMYVSPALLAGALVDSFLR